MSEPIYKLRKGSTLPFGIKQWHVIVDIVPALIAMQLFQVFVPGRLGALLGLFSLAGIAVGIQFLLFRVDDRFPGKAIPQYFRFLNEADYYLPGRDKHTQPLRLK